MIYPLLAACVLLAAFAVISTALSVAAVGAWRLLRRHTGSMVSANAAFRLRVLPTTSALLVTGACLFPAFHLFEPRDARESAGLVLWTCAAAGVALIAGGLGRGWQAWRSTVALQRAWLEHATPLRLAGGKHPRLPHRKRLSHRRSHRLLAAAVVHRSLGPRRLRAGGASRDCRP